MDTVDRGRGERPEEAVDDEDDAGAADPRPEGEEAAVDESADGDGNEEVLLL